MRLCLVILFSLPSVIFADEPKMPELRTELLSRVKEEQKARFALIEHMKKGKIKADHPQLKKVQELDAENRAWLGKQIEKVGWPGASKVGKDGAHAAWLLVQHADADREFQKQCLKLMHDAAEGEVAPADIAYLEDRIRAGEGKKQLYGTQLHMVKGVLQPKPIEDAEKVDERRKKMGMPSLEDYLKMARKMYAGSKK